MNENKNLLHEDLIFLNYKADSKEELLTKLSNVLFQKGYVKDSFLEGILEREKVFPTGLNTEGIKVAIPHTDAKHVNSPAILVAKLNEQVTFKEMGSNINDVDARLIFMLAIKNPDEQVKTLSKLMSIFLNKEVLMDVYNSTTSKMILDKLTQFLYNN